jgi:hypothetical protein
MWDCKRHSLDVCHLEEVDSLPCVPSPVVEFCCDDDPESVEQQGPSPVPIWDNCSASLYAPGSTVARPRSAIAFLLPDLPDVANCSSSMGVEVVGVVVSSSPMLEWLWRSRSRRLCSNRWMKSVELRPSTGVVGCGMDGRLVGAQKNACRWPSSPYITMG